MQAIIGAALQQRVLVLILSVALMVGGLFAYKQLNIEAYPDPVPPLVEIVTQNPGQSSEEIERYITIPIEVQMAGLPYNLNNYNLEGQSLLASGWGTTSFGGPNSDTLRSTFAAIRPPVGVSSPVSTHSTETGAGQSSAATKRSTCSPR